MESLKDDMPLYRRATKGENGLQFSDWMTHADVEKQQLFTLIDKCTKKEYYEV